MCLLTAAYNNCLIYIMFPIVHMYDVNASKSYNLSSVRRILSYEYNLFPTPLLCIIDCMTLLFLPTMDLISFTIRLKILHNPLSISCTPLIPTRRTSDAKLCVSVIRSMEHEIAADALLVPLL